MKPTMKFVLNSAARAQLALLDHDDAVEALTHEETTFANYFNEMDMKKQMVISLDEVELLETGEILEDYKGIIASRFTRGGVLHIATTDGNIIPIKFSLEDTNE